MSMQMVGCLLFNVNKMSMTVHTNLSNLKMHELIENITTKLKGIV